MPQRELVDALLKQERLYADAIDTLRDPASESAISGAAWKLREAVELVRCLRRLLAGRTTEEIHRAFGAPGDFGYETPIGEALSRLYRAEVSR